MESIDANQKRRGIEPRRALLAAAALCMTVTGASAQTVTWTNPAGGDFGTATNWSNAAVPNAVTDIQFWRQTTAGPLTVALGGVNRPAHQLGVTDVDLSLQLDGATLTLGDSVFIGRKVVGSLGPAAVNLSDGTVLVNSPTASSRVGNDFQADGTLVAGTGATFINNGTLIVGAAGRGTLLLNSGTVAVNGDLWMGFFTIGTGTVQVNSGAMTVTGNAYVGGTNTVGAGTGVFNAQNGTTTVTNTLRIWDKGIVNYSGGELSSGPLRLSGGGKLLLSSGGGKVLRTTSVSVDSALGKLDVADNAMIVDYAGGASPIVDVMTLIQTGYNNGAWTGNAITSSSAASAASTAVKTGLGFAEATDLFTSFPAVFGGQQVDDTGVLVRYTLYGDANLDRVVNINDFALLAANFNTPSRWSGGDFNYDGTTGINDFALLAANFNQVLPADLPALSEAEAPRGDAVPEPATLLAALLAAPFALNARRPRGR